MLGVTCADIRSSYEHRSLHEPAILYVGLHNKEGSWLTNPQIGRRFHGGHNREDIVRTPPVLPIFAIHRVFAISSCLAHCYGEIGFFIHRLNP